MVDFQLLPTRGTDHLTGVSGGSPQTGLFTCDPCAPLCLSGPLWFKAGAPRSSLPWLNSPFLFSPTSSYLFLPHLVSSSHLLQKLPEQNFQRGLAGRKEEEQARWAAFLLRVKLKERWKLGKNDTEREGGRTSENWENKVGKCCAHVH